MDVAADGDGALDGLHVRLVDEDFPCLQVARRGDARPVEAGRAGRECEGEDRRRGIKSGPEEKQKSSQLHFRPLVPCSSTLARVLGAPRVPTRSSGRRTNLIAQPLDIELGQLLAVRKMGDPCVWKVEVRVSELCQERAGSAARVPGPGLVGCAVRVWVAPARSNTP